MNLYNMVKYVTNRGRINLGLQYFAMKNLDTLETEKKALAKRMTDAVKAGDDDAFAVAFGDYTDALQEAVMAEARGMVDAADNRILAGRGARALTSEESGFYNKLAGALTGGNPRQALTDTEVVLPKTVIDSVFEDLAEAHPLLGAINFQNTAWLTEILVSTTGGVAVWGDVTDEIDGELSAAFGKIDLTKSKLTAYILVPKGMLDLGPVWVDRYVRALLGEALAAQLEGAIVDGDGDKKPLGMTRALTGAVDGVYPRKTPITVTALDQTTYATILNELSQGPNGKRRAISGIALVVNPADYYTKIMPATTVRNTDGGFVHDVFPFPTAVYQSTGVPAGKAVFGLLPRYFAGLGSPKNGRIDFDDSVKFMEDQRAYAIRLYGDGKPLDAKAFVYADISGLVPYTPRVYVTNSEFDVNMTNESLNVLGAYDARLASLKIGSLTLSPAFNKSVMAYTAATSNATNTVTAVAVDGEGTIQIFNGETEVVNGAAATWTVGANVLTVNVTSGTETETYTVTVTYTAG